MNQNSLGSDALSCGSSNSNNSNCHESFLPQNDDSGASSLEDKNKLWHEYKQIPQHESPEDISMKTYQIKDVEKYDDGNGDPNILMHDMTLDQYYKDKCSSDLNGTYTQSSSL